MSEGQQQRETVEIMGEVLPVKTTDKGDQLRRARALVEDKIESIQDHSPEASRLQAALLSSLNLAGQLVKMEDSPEEMSITDETIERLKQLESRIDHVLDEEST
jgi:cell division protein ZapA (FtsZ GTPase activity inhibitor)